MSSFVLILVTGCDLLRSALILASRMADIAVGVAPACGWAVRERYADANLLFDVDTQLSHAEPVIMHHSISTLAEHDVERLAANLVGIPVLVRTASDDTSVPAWHSRRISRVLREVGVQVTHSELSGKGHWWWDSEKQSDGGVVNDAEMRNFFTKCWRRSMKRTVHRNIVLVVFNPASSGTRCGIQILTQRIPLRMSRVEASVDAKNSRSWRVVTQNVLRILIGGGPSALGCQVSGNVQIDGQPFEIDPGSRIELCKDGAMWEQCTVSILMPFAPYPARRVFAQPWVIVAGNGAAGRVSSEVLLAAAVYIANGCVCAPY